MIPNRTRIAVLLAASALALSFVPAPASAQAGLLLRLRTGAPAEDRVLVDSAGGLVAFSRLGSGVNPATGPGDRLVWHPFRVAFRAGRVSSNEWDDANVGFFSWAGGHNAIAYGQASFAMGYNVRAEGNYSAAFGTGGTVQGSNGFVAGEGSTCTTGSNWCVAMGYSAAAGGRGAVALGYSTTASADHSFALGRMASTSGHTGAFVWGDASVNDSVRATANNQFTVRARGGIRLRTSFATGSNVGADMNTGCDIPGNSGVMTCASSRTVKEDFEAVDGEEVLARVRGVPVTTWRYIGADEPARHMGPMAEDFHAAFGLGPNASTIGHLDIAGVNLAAVRALERRTREQEDRIGELEAQVAELRGLVRDLAAERAPAASPQAPR